MATSIDPKMYGGEDLPPEIKSPVPVVPVIDTTPVPTAPVASILQGSVLDQQATAIREEGARTPATIMESVGAAFRGSSIGGVYDYLNKPTAPTDMTGEKMAAILKSAPIQLSKDDVEFIQKQKSVIEANWAIEQIQHGRVIQQALGDHPIVSGIVGFADVGYIVPDVLTANLSKAYRLGRVASAVAAGVEGAALTHFRANVEPTSTEDYVRNILMNSAATAVFYGKSNALEPMDATKPVKELIKAVDSPSAVIPPELPKLTPQTYVGEMQVRIAPGGEGSTPLQYQRGSTIEGAVSDYHADIPMDKPAQSALFAQGRVAVVGTVAEVAQHIPSVENGRVTLDPKAKAAYFPAEDRVVLIKENIKPTDDVKGILLHEYGVHQNAERILGTEGLGKVLMNLEDRAIAGEVRALQAFKDVPKNTPAHLVREEALGYFVERNAHHFDDSIINRFIAGARDLLRGSVLKSLKYSDNDLVQLVRKVARKADAGAVSFDAAFPYVWHGSPVKGINQLDLAYAGSGEGRAAFGYGHYLSSEKGTGLDYRNKEALKRGLNPDEGGLYRVKIKATVEDFLDLESTKQSKQVQQALKSLEVPKGLTGKAAYEYLTNVLGSQQAASQALYEAGVVGNRYSTGRTRHAQLQNSNYVVFHDSVVDTVARYSMPIAPTAEEVTKAVLGKVDASDKTWAKIAGEKIEWTIGRTFRSFGEVGKELSELLFDSQGKYGVHSVESEQRAIKLEATRIKWQHDDILLRVMADNGFGHLNQIKNYKEAVAFQQGVEKEVHLEMLRRDTLNSKGLPQTQGDAPQHIQDMADALGKVGARLLDESKAAGVLGAEGVKSNPGYIPRVWDSGKLYTHIEALKREGLSEKDAVKQLGELVGTAIQRDSKMHPDVANKVGNAIIDRALRKGMFEDAAHSTAMENANVIRDSLKGMGLSPTELGHVMDIVTGGVNEAGKTGAMKHRISMDYTTELNAGSVKISVTDLFDHNVSGLMDKYIDRMSSQAAFAKKGLPSVSSINEKRTEFIKSQAGNPVRAQEAATLFDESLAHMRGEPAGPAMPAMLRTTSAVNRMISLGKSALWQITEYAPIAAKYGVGTTLKYFVKEMPMFKGMLETASKDKHYSQDLKNILSDVSSESLRLKPFQQRYADGFEIPASNAAHAATQHAAQYVPIINGMKFIHNHQANLMSNLVINTLEKAANGDTKMAAKLARYGVDADVLNALKSDIQTHGYQVDKWADSTWKSARPAFMKMMDEGVLHQRMGDMPAWALLSPVGKFVCTYRGFVLQAHNKLLAGGLQREGFAGMSLLMLYQFPLALLAVNASAAIDGKPALTEKQMIAAGIGQTGGLGILSELASIALGVKRGVGGATALIPFDRTAALATDVVKGNFGDVGHDLYKLSPLLAVFPPLLAMDGLLHNAK